MYPQPQKKKKKKKKKERKKEIILLKFKLDRGIHEDEGRRESCLPNIDFSQLYCGIFQQWKAYKSLVLLGGSSICYVMPVIIYKYKILE
jgi:hypothetical protein